MTPAGSVVVLGLARLGRLWTSTLSEDFAMVAHDSDAARWHAVRSSSSTRTWRRSRESSSR